MFGAFLHYDYLHNEVIELGTVGLSPGILSNYKLGNKWELLTSVQLGAIIIGGATSDVDLAQFATEYPEVYREYVLGPGILAKIDASLEHPKIGNLIARYAHYTVFIYSGPEGTEKVNLLDLRYQIPIISKLSIGINYTLYFRTVNYVNFEDFQSKKINLYEFKTNLSWRF